jgi:hypothetical protein
MLLIMQVWFQQPMRSLRFLGVTLFVARSQELHQLNAVILTGRVDLKYYAVLFTSMVLGTPTVLLFYKLQSEILEERQDFLVFGGVDDERSLSSHVPNKHNARPA